MLSALARLEHVDALSDDDPPSRPAQEAAAQAAAAAEVAAQPKQKQPKKKVLTKKPSSGAPTSHEPSTPSVKKKPAAQMKRPAACVNPARIVALKYRYHKLNKWGIKVKVGAAKPREFLTVPGTSFNFELFVNFNKALPSCYESCLQNETCMITQPRIFILPGQASTTYVSRLVAKVC